MYVYIENVFIIFVERTIHMYVYVENVFIILFNILYICMYT